ncbi:hypothetical protein NG2371_02994 [Nocardia gamkensis]|nr:hypothetical protein [Nocardia gamkensis]
MFHVNHRVPQYPSTCGRPTAPEVHWSRHPHTATSPVWAFAQGRGNHLGPNQLPIPKTYLSRAQPHHARVGYPPHCPAIAAPPNSPPLRPFAPSAFRAFHSCAPFTRARSSHPASSARARSRFSCSPALSARSTFRALHLPCPAPFRALRPSVRSALPCPALFPVRPPPPLIRTLTSCATRGSSCPPLIRTLTSRATRGSSCPPLIRALTSRVLPPFPSPTNSSPRTRWNGTSRSISRCTCCARRARSVSAASTCARTWSVRACAPSALPRALSSSSPSARPRAQFSRSPARPCPPIFRAVARPGARLLRVQRSSVRSALTPDSSCPPPRAQFSRTPDSSSCPHLRALSSRALPALHAHRSSASSVLMLVRPSALPRSPPFRALSSCVPSALVPTTSAAPPFRAFSFVCALRRSVHINCVAHLAPSSPVRRTLRASDFCAVHQSAPLENAPRCRYSRTPLSAPPHTSTSRALTFACAHSPRRSACPSLARTKSGARWEWPGGRRTLERFCSATRRDASALSKYSRDWLGPAAPRGTRSHARLTPVWKSAPKARSHSALTSGKRSPHRDPRDVETPSTIARWMIAPARPVPDPPAEDGPSDPTRPRALATTMTRRGPTRSRL